MPRDYATLVPSELQQLFTRLWEIWSRWNYQVSIVWTIIHYCWHWADINRYITLF